MPAELSNESTQSHENIKALLLDIEGTTTPVDFVYKTLFPFAASHVEEFLRAHRSDTEIDGLLSELRTENGMDRARMDAAPAWNETTETERIGSASAYVKWLIEKDRKLTPLKTLQGKIWEEGFRTGELKGEVYEDVAPAFSRWKRWGKRIAIFSSGSVLAQKLLFAHSTAGDLSIFLSGYFDTTTGPKREAESYRKISRELQLKPDEILFISDVVEELDAAKLAGMVTALAVRGDAQIPDGGHPAITKFSEIFY